MAQFTRRTLSYPRGLAVFSLAVACALAVAAPTPALAAPARPIDVCAPYKTRIAELERQLAAARREAALLRGQLNVCRAALQTSAVALDRCRASNVECRTALVVAREQAEAARLRAARLAEENAALVAENARCNGALASCEAELKLCHADRCEGVPVLCDRAFPPCPRDLVQIGTGPCEVACVNPDTCEHVCTPLEEGVCASRCESDAECATGSHCELPDPCPVCVTTPCPCEGLCRPNACSDGTPLTCRRAIPECEAGTELAIQDGCYVCVDPDTCAPPEDCPEGETRDEAGRCCGPIYIADCFCDECHTLRTFTAYHDNGCIAGYGCECVPATDAVCPPVDPCDLVMLPECTFDACPERLGAMIESGAAVCGGADYPNGWKCGNTIGDETSCVDGQWLRVVHPPLSPDACNLTCRRTLR